MAHAHAASVYSHVQSVRGFTRSLTGPFYRRLLEAEPFLCRIVPILIIVFLAVVAIGAATQIVNHRRETLANAEKTISLHTLAIGEKVSRMAADDFSPEKVKAALKEAISREAAAAGIRFYIADSSGRILAAAPAGELAANARLSDILDPGRLLTVLAERAGVIAIALADGSEALALVHHLNQPLGQIAATQPVARALERWHRNSALLVTLVASTGFVLLLLGFAFHWQALRTREADAVSEMIRARMDTALNRGRCGLWDWDLGRGRIYWSSSMFEIVGLKPRTELLSFGEVDALVHADDGSLYDIAKNLADAAEGAVDRSFRMRHANGEWVWLRARAELVHQNGGDIAHIVGIAVDVTEEKRQAERTATADVRLRDAIDTISEAFVIWDSEDRLVLCNSKFQQLHGLPDSAIAPGTSYEDVISAGSQPVIRTPLKSEDRAEEGSRSFEAQLGDTRWFKISERRTKDGGFVSVGTDITALKRHEEQLMESEKRLMATIADLRQTQQTLEIQAQQLAELAQKYSEEKTRAEEANQAKSEFLANMSHELRTPLNAIIGFSEIMESGLFGQLGAEKYHEYCSDIQESGRYLLEVINDILDMSKIEAGRLRLDHEEIQLDAIAAEATRVMSVMAGEKCIKIESEIAPAITMRGDRRALKQILINLLSNSIKFTGEGGRVAMRSKLSRGHAILLIEDSGIGISKAMLRKLGRPFEQVESRFTKTHKGSGLGLAIAKSLIELHGGNMRIRSIENVGTTVIVRLPLANPVVAEQHAAA